MNLHLDWCSYEAAKYACEHWHYSQTVPATPLRIGVWEHNKFIGCVLFSHGANKSIGSPYGLNQQECCELVRVALTTHANPVTKILSIALKLLQKHCPGIRLVVSYADKDQGHDGGIYKGGNWVYVGTVETGRCFIIKGKKTHPKSVHSKGIRQTINDVRKYLDPNATLFMTSGKHKYLMPLDDDMREQIEYLRKPYPKRVKQAIGSDQEPAEGQHLPTRSISGDETE